MSFLGAYIILMLSFGVSTTGFLVFLLGGIGDGCLEMTVQQRQQRWEEKAEKISIMYEIK